MRQKTYSDLFFDLDHTLWDFNKNSEETLEELFNLYALKELGISAFEDFLHTYRKVNDLLWEQYRHGSISKTELRSTRFNLTFKEYKLEHPELAKKIDQDYISKSPTKTHLFPYTLEVLEYLSSKYRLHIITNGFEEVQDIKMSASGLQPYFHHKITSDLVGVNKPDPKIFTYALRSTGAKRNQSLMIGDNLPVDIIGARNVGMDQVYFNPEKAIHSANPTYEISCLSELKRFL